MDLSPATYCQGSTACSPLVEGSLTSSGAMKFSKGAQSLPTYPTTMDCHPKPLSEVVFNNLTP
jgi:hypothetical protein